MKTAFLGLGRMGSGMAARLVGALGEGVSLTVWNRNQERCEPLRALGAAVAASPLEAVSGADLVFTMLSDDAALAAVMDDATVSAMARGGAHVSMSTISVDLAVDLAKRHAGLGRGYLGCPVFGRPDAAASGGLKLCLSGAGEHKGKAMPLLPAMGEVWDFGEDPASAHAVKLTGNFMIASTIELMGEAFSLAEKHGIRPERFYEFISSTIFAAPIVKNYGRVILEADLDNPGFTTVLGAKDVRLIRQAARSSHTPLPMAAVLEERVLRLLAKGWGARDWTSMAAMQREDAGLE